MHETELLIVESGTEPATDYPALVVDILFWVSFIVLPVGTIHLVFSKLLGWGIL